MDPSASVPERLLPSIYGGQVPTARVPASPSTNMCLDVPMQKTWTLRSTRASSMAKGSRVSRTYVHVATGDMISARCLADHTTTTTTTTTPHPNRSPVPRLQAKPWSQTNPCRDRRHPQHGRSALGREARPPMAMAEAFGRDSVPNVRKARLPCRLRLAGGSNFDL